MNIKEKEHVEKKRNSVPFLTSGIGTRINDICGKVGGKKRLAEMIGISESQLHRIISGESQPRIETVALIAEAAGVSLDSLAIGKESYQELELPDKDKLVIKEDFVHSHSDSDWSEFAKIPLYDVEVSAGYGSVVDQEQIKGVIAFRQDWLRSKGLQQSKVITLTAKGDSMQPTIDHGDLLLVDCNTKNVTSDSIYVIRRDGHLFVKRLQQMISGDLYIKSDNPTYTQETIPKHEVKNLDIIGRVVWIGHEI